MPLQAVETERVYRRIVAQLAALIASGELPPGARLPSERDLAKRLRVSRPSVRQALIALELEGKVQVQVGVGVFVAPPPPATMVDPAAEDQDPRSLFLPRWLIESEIAVQAARSAGPKDLDVVRAAVEEMERCQEESRDPDAADRRFHLAIAEATHNGTLVMVAHNLWEQCRGPQWRRVAAALHTLENRAAALKEHHDILGALEARDAQRSRAAMRRHLKRLERDFRRNWLRVTKTAPAPAPEDRGEEPATACA